MLVGFDVIRFILKVLAKLEEAWINERNSPELLHPRMEMVGSIGKGPGWGIFFNLRWIACSSS